MSGDSGREAAFHIWRKEMRETLGLSIRIDEQLEQAWNAATIARDAAWSDVLPLVMSYHYRSSLDPSRCMCGTLIGSIGPGKLIDHILNQCRQRLTELVNE